MILRALKLLGFVVLAQAVFLQPAHAVYIGEDIGNTLPGSDTGVQPPGQVSITGDGADIWGNADAFRYFDAPWSGSFIAMVRFLSVNGGSDSWRKLGIMARLNSTPGSPFAMIAATPQQIAVQWRDAQDGGAGWANSFMPGSPSAGTTPFWLKMRRTGTTVTSYWAPDVGGKAGTWSTPRPEDTHVVPGLSGAALELGLAVTSHNGGQLTTGTFDNFSVEAIGSPVGRLKLYDASNIGVAAYAQLPDSTVVGPVHWKLEQLHYGFVPNRVMSEWYLGTNYGGTQLLNIATSGQPHSDFLISQIAWSNQGAGSPNPNGYPPETGYSGDMGNFSTRHWGQILVPDNPANPGAPRTVRFQDHNDDWAILTVDGTVTGINDGNWTNYDGTANVHGGMTTTLSLTPGWHDFQFFESEGGGGDNARLLWDYDLLSNAFGGSFATVASDYYRVRSLTLIDLLAEGNYNVGSPTTDGIFYNIGSRGGEDMFVRLTVDYQGTSVSYEGEFFGTPEPTTCLLLGAGLLALLRRRRR